MKRLLFFISFMVFGTGGFYLLLISGPQPKAPDRSDEEPAPAANTIRMTGSDITLWKGPSPDWKIRSKNMVYQENGERVFLKNVDFIVYPEGTTSTAETNQPGVVTGKSDTAQIHFKRKMITLSGNVRVLSPPDTTITTGKLIYQERQQILTAPAEATVKAGDITYRGTALTYDLKSEKLDMNKPFIIR